MSEETKRPTIEIPKYGEERNKYLNSANSLASYFVAEKNFKPREKKVISFLKKCGNIIYIYE